MGLASVARMAGAAFLIAAPVWADAFKWRDESGRIHYSDAPPVGADLATDNQDLLSVETYECDTEACQAEEEELAREAAERHALTLQWLEQREQEKNATAQRQEADDDEPREISAPPQATSAPPVWPFGALPDVN